MTKPITKRKLEEILSRNKVEELTGASDVPLLGQELQRVWGMLEGMVNKVQGQGFDCPFCERIGGLDMSQTPIEFLVKHFDECPIQKARTYLKEIEDGGL